MARIKPQALLQQSKKKKGPARMSLTTIILFSLIVVLIVFFLFSTYRHWTHRFVKFCSFLFSVCIWILIKWDSLSENGRHENFGISGKIFEIIKKDSIWVGVKINAVYAWWEKVRVLRYGLAKLIEPGTWNLDVVGLTKWLSWIMP